MLLTWFRAEFKAAGAEGGGGIEAFAYIDSITPSPVRGHGKHGQSHTLLDIVANSLHTVALPPKGQCVF